MTDLISKIEDFVLHLFKDKLSNNYIYHNFSHTKRVVESASFLAKKENIHPEDQEILLIAAWFHDTGYTQSEGDHESESMRIASEFLENETDFNSEKIEKVKNLIAVTKLGETPETLLEKILKDADCSHFAREDFNEISELLRQELKLLGKANYKSLEWQNINIQMLTEKHRFYTNYAVEFWQTKKQDNLIKLIESKNKKEKRAEKERMKAKYKAKYKNESPERSIQTLFRVTLRNHLKLSDIADTKANILLSVNAIIISLALANIIPKLDSPSNAHLMIPTLILICFSVASIILSIMSTRPNVTSGEFTKEQVMNREVNILFFGNFHKMKYEDYLWGVKEIIQDKEFVYEALVKDLYLLGKVLDRKYRLLRLTYTIFMLGIIVSVVSFFFAFDLI
ncbi:Pycsar system effector family protein [Psychroflexus aestuariivivens]|uniref:Pycsar system effector family protein n=1 Tax=Psychroflexus aestuariivivens TaxID=1795040 RepID=UPI000FD79AEC|nr:Pycsar system effector family protein [Psychroflexus aestuariivivens]